MQHVLSLDRLLLCVAEVAEAQMQLLSSAGFSMQLTLSVHWF